MQPVGRISDQFRYRRVRLAVAAIERGAKILGIGVSEERALDLFYSTGIYGQLTDPRTGLYLMSDGYILEDLRKQVCREGGL